MVSICAVLLPNCFVRSDESVVVVGCYDVHVPLLRPSFRCVFSLVLTPEFLKSPQTLSETTEDNEALVSSAPLALSLATLIGSVCSA